MMRRPEVQIVNPGTAAWRMRMYRRRAAVPCPTVRLIRSEDVRRIARRMPSSKETLPCMRRLGRPH